MLSPRTPKSPITFKCPPKAHSDKSNKMNDSTSSKKIINKTLPMSPMEATTAYQQSQNKTQKNQKDSTGNQKNIEDPYSFLISNQLNQEMHDNESIESLKQKINQLSDFLSRQTEIINKLDCIGIISENLTDSPSLLQNSDPFLNIKYRIQFIIDNYVNQKKRYDELLENEHQQKNPTYLNQRASEVDEYIQEELGSNYTIAQIKDIFQRNSKSGQKIQGKTITDDHHAQTDEKTQDTSDEDKQISDKVKSFYLNRNIHSNLLQQIEDDIDLSLKVRCFFNGSENNEAILNTIQSIQETAKDNQIISNLTLNLQQLIQNARNINKKHQEEMNEKEKEIDYLKGQLEIQKNTIQNLNMSIEKAQQKLNEKDNSMLEKGFENQMLIGDVHDGIENDKKIAEIRQVYETKLSELQDVKNKLLEQQKLNDQKEKENIKLRSFINKVKTILKVNTLSI